MSGTAAVEETVLLKPTLHIEVLIKDQPAKQADRQRLRDTLEAWFLANYVTVRVGQEIVVD
ncbi:hypothetical protein LTR53_019727, partial [Teratosphaeriaceae sp. CCFEE 6253]